MKVETGTRFDKDPNVDMIWPVGAGGNGECFVLKMGDHYRILKILVDKSGRGLDIESTALENYQIPFMPSLYDKSSNYEGEEKKKCWILIDYIPGPTLDEFISGGFEGYRIKKLIILKILICLVFQLSEMNKFDLKHRDIKPDNIIIDANLVPHIVDWGDATTRNSLSFRNVHGTAPFTAPEVFENVRSTKSDIYSFGCVIFNMITQHFPYDDAYKSREGLNNYIKDDIKVPSELDDYYEILDEEESLDDEDNRNFSKIMTSVLKEVIQKHIVDTRFIHEDDFLKDELNARLSELIDKCREFDYEKRYSEDKIAKYLVETVKNVVKYVKECIPHDKIVDALVETTEKFISDDKLEQFNSESRIPHDKIVEVLAKAAQKVLSDDELKKFKYETHRLNYKIVESLNTAAKEVLSADEFKNFDYVTRSPQERIADFLDETAKIVLSPDELKEYEEYCDYIASVEPGTEYGTSENIKATFDNGLYQVNKTLKAILKYNGFEVADDKQKFGCSLLSNSPFVSE